MTQTATSEAPPGLAEELAKASAQFETAPAGKVVSWVFERFGTSAVLAASFQDVVLVDIVTSVDPRAEIVFLDTGAHFRETLDFVEEMRSRYGLNLTVTRPGPDAAAVPCGTEGCCQVRKVAPLRKVLDGRGAWMTSLKRADAPTRASAPIVEWDPSFGLVKVNPLATWTEDDVAGYLVDHGLPRHPLVAKGYLSIGCAPTTRPVVAGEDPRAGRWSGTDKVECGLHG